jgi:hypothetical protein
MNPLLCHFIRGTLVLLVPICVGVAVGYWRGAATADSPSNAGGSGGPPSAATLPTVVAKLPSPAAEPLPPVNTAGAQPVDQRVIRVYELEIQVESYKNGVFKAVEHVTLDDNHRYRVKPHDSEIVRVSDDGLGQRKVFARPLNMQIEKSDTTVDVTLLDHAESALQLFGAFCDDRCPEVFVTLTELPAGYFRRPSPLDGTVRYDEVQRVHEWAAPLTFRNLPRGVAFTYMTVPFKSTPLEPLVGIRSVEEGLIALVAMGLLLASGLSVIWSAVMEGLVDRWLDRVLPKSDGKTSPAAGEATGELPSLAAPQH